MTNKFHDCGKLYSRVDINTNSEFYPNEWAMVIGKDEYWQFPVDYCPFCGVKLE